MEHTRLSVLAQKAELHCLLILVIHPFQIWVHKIKNEKYVGLVLALQKGGGGGNQLLMKFSISRST